LARACQPDRACRATWSRAPRSRPPRIDKTRWRARIAGMLRAAAGARPPCCHSSLAVLLVALLLLSARTVQGNGADLPPRIVLQGFVRSEPGRLQLLLRVPLVLL